MRTFRANAGPFSEGVYYAPKEVETICSDELRSLALYPSVPEPIRIDRFIKKRFGVEPTYEDLPAGILGYTEFGKSGVVGVFVSRALSEDGSTVSDRRLSTTLAHEAGHGLLHSHLFVLEREQLTGLFREGLDPQAPKILCRDGDIAGRPAIKTNSKKYDGRWWELQANMAIGALLLPRSLVLKALEGFVERQGSFGHAVLPLAKRAQAVRALVDVFDVNRVVVEIRLSEIFPLGGEAQLSL